MSRKILIVILYLVARGSIVAWAAEITGTVRDKENGKPVPYADVSLPKLRLGVNTGEDGGFLVLDVPPGTYTLVVEHVNYETWKEQVQAGDTRLNVRMRLKEHIADKVVITATGYDKLWMETSLPVNVIDKDKLEERIAFSMVDLFRGEPGLDVSSTGSGSVRPAIRGLFDERVLILIDGVRLSEQRPGGNHVLSVDPAQIDRVEVIRGPASVLYGSDAIGGVVNIITKKGTRKSKGDSRFQINQEGAYESASDGWRSTTHAQYNRGRVNLHLGGSYRDTRNLNTPEGELPHSYYRGGTLWSGGERVGREWSAGLRYSYQQADIGVPADSVFLEDYFDDEKHQNLVADFHHEPEGGPYKQFKVDAGWQCHNRHRYRLRTPPKTAVQGNLEIQILLDIDTYFLQPRLIFECGRNHIISVGVQGFYEDATSARTIVDTDPTSSYNNPFNRVPVIPPSTRAGMGIYLQDEIRANSKWTVTPGLRFDYIETESEGHPEHQISEEVTVKDRAVSGNLGLLYKINREWSLYANAGRAFRAPTLLERFFFGPHDAAKDDMGNPDLDPETSWNFDAGVKTLSSRWRGQLGLFHNTVEDFISKVDVDTALAWQNLGNAHLYGAELGLECVLHGGLTGFGNLSYVRGEDRDTGADLPAMPPLRSHYGVRYNHEVNEIRRVWSEVGVFWSDAQERPGPGEKATASWTRLDVRAGFVVSKHLRVVAAVENVTDELYHDHLSRVWQDLGFNDQPGRNIKVSARVVF